MKIIKLHKDSKAEDKNIYPFLKHYCKRKGVKGDIKYVAIPEDTPEKTPDYYVNKINALVEIKEVHDQENRARYAQWSKIVDNLRKQARKNKKLKEVKGLYSVRTPSTFKFPTDKKQIKEAADQILGTIIKGKPSVMIHNVTFELEKVSDEDSGVSFSASGLGGWFDAAQTIHENIKDKLTTVDRQLGFEYERKKIDKKILLLSNQYPLLHWDWDLYKALSYSYEQLLSYNNIDEIWFQNPQQDGSYTHDLLYTHDFLQGVHNQQLTVNIQNARLFADWFSSLEKLGDEHKERSFNTLQDFLVEKSPHEWFENTTAREEMLRIGTWLADNNRYNHMDWLIEQFIDDPDPAEPKDDDGDSENNYHQQIINGEDPNIITTVLGHLAWVVQKLASQSKDENKQYTLKAFEYTDKLLQHKNYYVKLQAIIPLIEITKRRQWLHGYGKRHNNGKRIKNSRYRKFHEAVFNLLKIVEENPNCVAIAKWLTHIFVYYKDLSTKETKRVLNALKISSDSAGLFVYFGIYRKDHYKKQNIEFDSKQIEEMFEALIKNDDPQYLNLRGSIAWHFWKILDENPDEFKNENIRGGIDLFLNQPYQKNIYNNIERVIRDWIEKKPDVCIGWFETYLDNVYEYVKKNEGDARDIWLRMEKLVEIIAKENPGKLLESMKKLVFLWKQNVYVGSPKGLFETYALIQNYEDRTKTKKQFKKWYEEMKKLNPKIEAVDWQKDDKDN